MKNIYLTLTLIFSCTFFLQSQDCSDLFISEYVEGYANNKALEIYNPTSAPINLSGYSVGRFSNGSTTAAPPSQVPAYIVQLPDVELQPYDVFVVVIDITDLAGWDSQFDKPAWNGYNVLDTLRDFVTGDPILDSLGNIIISEQYEETGNGTAAVFGDTYCSKYDLQCKADAFLCPEYEINRAVYFNGNDAVFLIKGTEVIDGSELVDVIGVIGEDPETTIGEDAWIDEDGYWLTKDQTLVRNADILKGRNAASDVIFASGGTFTGTEWTSYRKNSFQYLGAHYSTCDPTLPISIPLEFSCEGTPADECGLAVDIDDLHKIEANLFPNPTNLATGIQIEAEGQFDRVVIWDVTGKEVFSQVSNSSKLSIAPNVEAGYYMLALYQKDIKVFQEPVILQ